MRRAGRRKTSARGDDNQGRKKNLRLSVSEERGWQTATYARGYMVRHHRPLGLPEAKKRIKQHNRGEKRRFLGKWGKGVSEKKGRGLCPPQCWQ